ncbi:DMT family transporter [Gordonia shandongensis]|uniref:DMT family transporter n=1 Tax=Gordonia shandongensis TaxID=376351 RepID=UPI0004083461|nr:DMT family transporter [Gordonia shandongensis]
MSESRTATVRAYAPHLNLMVTMVMFGSAFASSKVVVGAMPHEVAAAFRFGGGALVLAAVVAVMPRRGQRLGRRNAIRAAAVGVIGVFAYNVLFFWGLSLAPSVDGTIIVPVLSPILTVVALFAFRGERVSRRQAVGLATGAVGAVVFLVAVGGSGDADRLVGDAIFVAAAAAWAGYSIVSKSVLTGIEPLRATTWGVSTGAVLLALYAAPHVGATAWSDVGATAWLNVVFLAIGPTAVAYLFYYRGLRHVSPTVATVMMFTVPVVGIACSYIFLGERINAGQIGGAVVLLVGALLAVVGPTAGGAPESRVRSSVRDD